jgi:Ca2+-binding EF-hand superfamily protein
VKGPFMAKFDTNGDGVLEPNERAAMRAAIQAKHAAKKAEMLAKYDTNRDGILEPNERKVMIDDRAAKQFAKMDVNNDGTVTLAEFQAFRESHAGRHARWGKGRFRSGLQGAQGAQGSQQAPQATQQAE